MVWNVYGFDIGLIGYPKGTTGCRDVWREGYGGEVVVGTCQTGVFCREETKTGVLGIVGLGFKKWEAER